MPVSYFLKATIVIGLILALFIPIIENLNSSDNRIYQTCQFVRDRVIPIEKNMTDWLQYCRAQSRGIRWPSEQTEKYLEVGNQVLSELQVSHLELFSEKENNAIWTDTDYENGLESRFIEGELVITRVYPQGEAHKKGLQRGDRVFLNTDESLSSYDLNRWKGKLKILRKNLSFTVDLQPKTMTIIRDLRITELNGMKILFVESFKGQYFSSEKLAHIKSKFKPTDQIIIDMRGNNGGNFIAGLRLLSAFICKPTLVGYLKKNKNLGQSGEFDNNLDDEYQITTLSKFDSINLKTFSSSESCLPKPQAILIDANSKSTAEWVALAFKEVLGTPIWGATSAGELLVGIWYDVSHIWNSVVKLSIPEAFYESLRGKRIEGRGVVVDKTLYPRRLDFENGYDSELFQAVSQLISGTD